MSENHDHDPAAQQPEAPVDPNAPQQIVVPPEIIINTLRGEVANLNDQRINLSSQLQWLQTIVAAQEEQLRQLNAGHTHEDPAPAAADDVSSDS